jgi:hypothetical protein
MRDDPVYARLYALAGGESPTCRDAADTNDDGSVAIGDAIMRLLHLFNCQGALPKPVGECGVDLTVDALECESFPSCESSS